MSNQKHRGALLEGYGKPLFPASLDEITWMLGLCELRAKLLERAAKIMGACKRGTYKDPHPTTSDGYRWAKWLTFTGGENPVVLVLPGKKDRKRRGNTPNDRYPAVYGAPNPRAAEELVRKFNQALRMAILEGLGIRCRYDKKKRRKKKAHKRK